MFDQTKTVTLTGVTYQFVAQANHAELHFYVLGPDDQPVGPFFAKQPEPGLGHARHVRQLAP